MAVGWQARIYSKSISVIGASGGIYGLLTSQTANLCLNWWELHILQRIIYTSLLVSCVTSDIIISVLYYNSNVSYSDHIGGALIGVFAGMCFLKNIRVIEWERKMKFISAGLMIVFFATSITNLFLL